MVLTTMEHAEQKGHGTKTLAGHNCTVKGTRPIRAPHGPGMNWRMNERARQRDGCRGGSGPGTLLPLSSDCQECPGRKFAHESGVSQPVGCEPLVVA